MKNIIYTLNALFFCSFLFSQELTEKQIKILAQEMSESLTNTKVVNSEILVNRVYSSKRDIVIVYTVPKDMILTENSIKKERIEQLKVYGGDFFYNNKINLVLWFMKDNIMYKQVLINYIEFKQ
jgi:hypothetical protein